MFFNKTTLKTQIYLKYPIFSESERNISERQMNGLLSCNLMLYHLFRLNGNTVASEYDKVNSGWRLIEADISRKTTDYFPVFC